MSRNILRLDAGKAPGELELLHQVVLGGAADAGLQLIPAMPLWRSATAPTDKPMRAQASAASQPTWPRPTTNTSNGP